MKKPSKKGKKNRCWAGYQPTPGKKAMSKGSCQKSGQDIALCGTTSGTPGGHGGFGQ